MIAGSNINVKGIFFNGWCTWREYT